MSTASRTKSGLLTRLKRAWALRRKGFARKRAARVERPLAPKRNRNLYFQ
jgi:hypothetical protein